MKQIKSLSVYTNYEEKEIDVHFTLEIDSKHGRELLDELFDIVSREISAEETVFCENCNCAFPYDKNILKCPFCKYPFMVNIDKEKADLESELKKEL